MKRVYVQVCSRLPDESEGFLSMEHMINAQLKRINDKIIVDKLEKIIVPLKLLSDISLEQSVLVSNSQTFSCIIHSTKSIASHEERGGGHFLFADIMAMESRL